MVIMFLLGAASTAGAVASTSAAVYHVLDGCHRLRLERLLPRAKRSGVNGLLTEAAMQVAGRVQSACQGPGAPHVQGCSDAGQRLLQAAVHACFAGLGRAGVGRQWHHVLLLPTCCWQRR